MKFKYNYFEIGFYQEFEYKNIFNLKGFNSYKLKTNIITLEDEKVNCKNLKGRARNMIRKAEKNKIKTSL